MYKTTPSHYIIKIDISKSFFFLLFLLLCHHQSKFNHRYRTIAALNSLNWKKNIEAGNIIHEIGVSTAKKNDDDIIKILYFLSQIFFHIIHSLNGASTYFFSSWKLCKSHFSESEKVKVLVEIFSSLQSFVVLFFFFNSAKNCVHKKLQSVLEIRLRCQIGALNDDVV